MNYITNDNHPVKVGDTVYYLYANRYEEPYYPFFEKHAFRLFKETVAEIRASNAPYSITVKLAERHDEHPRASLSDLFHSKEAAICAAKQMLAEWIREDFEAGEKSLTAIQAISRLNEGRWIKRKQYNDGRLPITRMAKGEIIEEDVFNSLRHILYEDTTYYLSGHKVMYFRLKKTYPA